jgi:hypothetical protein
LVAKRRKACGGEFVSEGIQKGMSHSGAGSVGKQQQPARFCGSYQQRRYFAPAFDREPQFSRGIHLGRILPERRRRINCAARDARDG